MLMPTIDLHTAPLDEQNNHFRITAFNRFQAVTVFLRKELNFKPTDSLVGGSPYPAPCLMVTSLSDHHHTLRSTYLHRTTVLVYQRILQSSARRHCGQPLQGKPTHVIYVPDSAGLELTLVFIVAH